MDGAWAWHLQRPPPGDWKWCLGSRKPVVGMEVEHAQQWSAPHPAQLGDHVRPINHCRVWPLCRLHANVRMAGFPHAHKLALSTLQLNCKSFLRRNWGVCKMPWAPGLRGMSTPEALQNSVQNRQTRA